MKKLFLILLLIATPAWGAITYDTTTLETCVGDCSSINIPAHVIGGGCTNPILIVGTGWDISTAVTLTSVATSGTGGGTLTSRATATDGDGIHSINLSSLTGMSGSQSITATFSGSTFTGTLTVSSYCGVHQSASVGTAVSNSSNDTPVTVDVTSATGELVVDVVFSHSTLTVGAGQTERGQDIQGGGFTYATSDEAGAGTVTMSWTQAAGHYWATVAIPMKPATATPTRKRLVMVE